MIDLTKELNLKPWEAKLVSLAIERNLVLPSGVFQEELYEKFEKAQKSLMSLPSVWQNLVTQSIFQVKR